MDIKIELTAAQEKALLTVYPSVPEYAQKMLVLRANERMDEILRDYAAGRVAVDALDAKEQEAVMIALGERVVMSVESCPAEVKEILMGKIVMRAAADAVVPESAEIAG